MNGTARPKFVIQPLATLFTFCLCGPTAFSQEPAKLNYADHVLPALRDKCIGCHNAEKARGGLDVSTYVKLMEGGSSGAVVKPGDPDESRLFLLSAHKAEPKMPPQGGAMPAEGLNTLRKWIEQGAIETATSKAPLLNKPKSDVALVSITKGRPAGPPPMPTAKLPLEIVRTPRPLAVTALASSPWAPLIAVAAPKNVLLLHADTLHVVGSLPFPHGQVNVLKFSRNGQLLLAGGGRGGKAGKVVVWNVADGKQMIEVGDEHDAVLAADLSADQTQIALGGPGKVVRIYATKDGEKLREIKKHTDWITAIEFSPDGVLLATGDRSSGLFVWEAFTGREYFSLRGPTQAITDLSWRADANVLAACGEDGNVRLFEMENGKQTRNWAAHGGGAQSVKFAHDNRLVSCGRDAVAKVWTPTGTLVKALPGMTDLATRAAFTHDDTKVVVGDWQGRLRLSTPDGTKLVEVTTTPPTPAEQFAEAQKLFTTKSADLAKAKAALKPLTANAEKARTELGAASKLASDSANIAKVIADAVAEAKAGADAATAAVAKAKQTADARDIAAKALAEAAAKIKTAADAAPTNADLKSAAEQAQQQATKAAADLTAAQKALADAQALAKTRSDKLAAAQKAASDTAVPAQTAQAALTAKQQSAKSANDALAAARTNVAKLEAEVKAVQTMLDQLKTVVASK